MYYTRCMHLLQFPGNFSSLQRNSGDVQLIWSKFHFLCLTFQQYITHDVCICCNTQRTLHHNRRTAKMYSQSDHNPLSLSFFLTMYYTPRMYLLQFSKDFASHSKNWDVQLTWTKSISFAFPLNNVLQNVWYLLKFSKNSAHRNHNKFKQC